MTRREAGLTNLEALRSASGVRIGAQAVGRSVYIVGRIFAYLMGLKEPKFVVGYSGPDLDLAVARGGGRPYRTFCRREPRESK